MYYNSIKLKELYKVALFKRDDRASVLPDEVNEYYESQRRERTGVAIVLGIAALIVTLLIGAALFFGGRWVYNQFTDDDDSNNSSSTSQTIDEQANEEDDLDRDEELLIDEEGNIVDEEGNIIDDSDLLADDEATDESFGDIELDGGEDDEESEQPATGDNPQALPYTGD